MSQMGAGHWATALPSSGANICNMILCNNAARNNAMRDNSARSYATCTRALRRWATGGSSSRIPPPGRPTTRARAGSFWRWRLISMRRSLVARRTSPRRMLAGVRMRRCATALQRQVCEYVEEFHAVPQKLVVSIQGCGAAPEPGPGLKCATPLAYQDLLQVHARGTKST